MKKCGIVTITGGTNYGNRLQNYALQTVLKQLGFDSETINHRPCYPEHKAEQGKLKSKIIEWKSEGLAGSLWDIRRILKKQYSQKKYPNLMQTRINNFDKFGQKYINSSKNQFYAQNDLSSFNEQYDFFIAGSDQIWNPYWEGADPFYFLSFAEKDKRVAYAPSFGVSSVPLEFQTDYRTRLEDIPYLSVREEKGREIIQTLINRDVPVLPDPTLLLDAGEWLKIAENTDNCPKCNYLLAYFLGKPSYFYHKAVTRYAEKYGLKIITLNNYMDPSYYTVNPSTFLNLVAHASLVCTDSFHGSVFSIVFNRPFITFERNGCSGKESMSSRIATLLGNLNLTDRMFQNENSPVDVLHIDFTVSNMILQQEKIAALAFLKTALRSSERPEE